MNKAATTAPNAGGVSRASTKDLKRVLGRGDLMSIAIGQIIGAGVMALTGTAIALTGKSVPIAYIISAVLMVILMVPQIFLAGTVRLRGGQYTQAAILVGKRWSGMYMVIFIVANISIAMYALSFADYFLAIVPGINPRLIAVAVLTVFYVVNIFGVKGAAIVQTLMVVLMAAALAAFAGFGLTKIQPDFLSSGNLFPGGIVGLLCAASLLTFATGGAGCILNFGAEAKNPTKDLPFVIIVSTLVVSVIYALMGLVGAGVLPIAEVANKPLSVVAKAIMPGPLFVFFVVGGAMFALITTLNATFGWVTKPLLQACVDGWFPSWLGTIGKKYKTPWVLLTVFYIVGLVPVLTGLDIGIVANFALILNLGFGIVLNLCIIRLPKVLPLQWGKSKFKVSRGWLWFWGIFSSLICLIQVALLGSQLNLVAVLGNLGIFVAGYGYALLREKSGKVNMEISYEDA